MNRQKLIPDVSTSDLAPKTPWIPEGLRARAEQIKAETAAPHIPPEPKKKDRSLAMKAFLSFIIVAVIVGMGILLPIKLIPGVSSMLANVFNAGDDDDSENTSTSTIEFSADKRRIDSGESVKISWNGPVRQDGSYSLTYPCIDGASVTLIAADDTMHPIACGEPFHFLSIDNTMTLSMDSESQRITVIPLSFAYAGTDNDTERLGSIEITVVSNDGEGNNGQTIVVNEGNQDATTTAPAGQNENGQVANRPTTVFDSDYYGQGSATTGRPTGDAGTQNSSSQTALYSGPADLQGRIYAVGKLDRVNGIFIPSNSFNTSDRVAVQFEVVNIGGSASGPWSFAAVLPTYDNKVYQSGIQASLPPYSGMVFTLGFDGIRTGTNNIMTISIDPQNYVRESNETNNIGSISWNVSGSGSSIGTGDADLKTTLIDVGYISGGTFHEDERIEVGDDAAIRFKVENVGGKASGSWDFRAKFIHEDGDEHEYESKSQTSLQPGQSVILTVSFKDVDDEGDYEFEIEVDANRDVDDSNRRNNDIDADIEVED